MPSAVKEATVIIAIIAIGVIIWYFAGGLRVPNYHIGTITYITTTSVPSSTTLTTTTIPYILSCSKLRLYAAGPNTITQLACGWDGGPLGLWVASGNSINETVTVVGAGNAPYINQTSSYQCTTFYNSFYAPSYNYYLVTLRSGLINKNATGNCTAATAIINTTTSAPSNITYQNVYNGDFGTGTYVGWNATGSGFGTAPFNITFANNALISCYVGSKWANYTGQYFATTYTCGLSTSPGNLTSAPLNASKSFLNFKIISPASNNMYVEILYNGTPYTVAHYNTFNISISANSQTTFRDASIPLFNVIAKPIQIRIVSSATGNRKAFLAVGDFSLSNRAISDRSIENGPYQYLR